MNPALWRKAVSDAWRQLAVSGLILVLFSWVFVWFLSQLPTPAFGRILAWLPDWAGAMFGMPLKLLATPAGQLSLLYIHVVTMLVCVGWAVGRGSDSISGEIGRGTMDLILSLPLRRASVIVPPAAIAAVGAAVLPGAILAGTRLGLWTTGFSGTSVPAAGGTVSVWQFLPGAINLCCMIFFMTGVTTFLSSWGRSRWRAISLAVAFYVISVIVEMIGRVCEQFWENGSWLKYGSYLKYCSFATAFQPHMMILTPEKTGVFALPYNGTLIGLGLVAYALAAVVLTLRDIPAAR